MLKLYADPEDRQILKQIDGLRSIRHRPIVRRVETPGPITFARGIEVTLLFDETAFEGQTVALKKAQGARPTGLYTAKDQGILAVVFRAQRSFATGN